MKKLCLWGIGFLLFASTGAAWGAGIPVVLPTIANANFETGAAAFATFPGYTGGANPAEITSWPGSGSRGINPGGGAGTPFRDNGNNGSNVAFMQGNNSTIGQTISGWEAGAQYRIAFDYNARSSGAGAPFVGVTATIGSGSFIDSSVPPVGGANSYYAGNLLFTPTSTSHTLNVTANVASGDKTLLVDNFRVFRNGPTIAHNGFESPNQGANTWEQANGTGGGTLAGSAWTITGSAGITQNFSAFQNGNVPAPEGVQHALIQGTGSFTQTISGFLDETDYNLSLSAMARQSGQFGNDLEVILDLGLPTELTILDNPLITANSFTELTSSTFTAQKDSYTLTIRSSLNGGQLTGDRTTFFDNVWFNQVTTAVPEPSTIVLWLVSGVALVGIAIWRRRI
jgi:hypothetical protein